jgi:RNA polymerase sigma-70 factor (ECF subfamily)
MLKPCRLRRHKRSPWRLTANFVIDPTVDFDRGTGTSTGLLQRVALRQADAWQKLVALYGPLVYRWCRRWGLQPKDAENVGQDVFVRVLQRLATFRPDGRPASFRRWLMRVTHNAFIDHLRQQQTVARPVGGDQGQQHLERLPAAQIDEAEESATAGDDRNILFRRAVELIQSEFSNRDWQAFAAVVLHGRKPADVAAELKVNTSLIYLIKSRVLRRLREEFAELIDV